MHVAVKGSSKGSGEIITLRGDEARRLRLQEVNGHRTLDYIGRKESLKMVQLSKT